MSTAASHASFLLPLEQPLRRAPLTGALCKSALTRAFRPTFSFCMALRASLTEFTTFTMLIWLSDSSCNTQKWERRINTYVHSQTFLINRRHPRLCSQPSRQVVLSVYAGMTRDFFFFLHESCQNVVWKSRIACLRKHICIGTWQSFHYGWTIRILHELLVFFSCYSVFWKNSFSKFV